jgi:hypothetical protein
VKQLDELIEKLDAAGRALEPASPQDSPGVFAVDKAKRGIAFLIGEVARVNWLADNTE